MARSPKSNYVHRTDQNPEIAPSETASRGWLWSFTALYALLGLALLAFVPLGRAPDEAAHWEYVQHLATVRNFPVFNASMIPPAPGYEFHQPPLYYLLCAPLWAATDAGVQNYLCRVVSLLCGLATVWTVWQAAQTLFPSRRLVPILATGLAASWPLLLGVGASANNDTLGALICAVLFWRIALLYSNESKTDVAWWRDALWIGVWSGLGVLTKNTCLVVSLVAFAALWQHARNAEVSSDGSASSEVLASWRAVGLAMAAMLLVSGWWLARNQMLYGDPLAYGLFSAAADAGTPGPQVFREQLGIGLFTYWRNLLIVLFCTNWGVFGGPSLVLRELAVFAPSGPRIPLWPITLAMLICALASMAMVVGVWKARCKYLQRRMSENADARAFVWRWWTVGVALGIAAWFSFAVAHFSGGQARYLLPILLPVCVLGARGWLEVFGRRAVFCALVFGATLIGLSAANAIWWRTLN